MALHRLLGSGLIKSATLATYQAKVLALGPIAYWPLNETAGSVATDVMNGYNGTYNSIAALADLAGPGASMGKLAKFNGTSSYVQLPAASLNTVFNPSEITLSIWGDLNEAWSFAAYRTLMSIGAAAADVALFYKNNGAQLYYAQVRGGNASFQVSAFSTAGWNHFALTISKSSNQMKMYTNGAQFGATQTVPGTWAGALVDKYSLIGLDLTGGGGSPWKGWLGHCSLFNFAASQAQVTALATTA